MENPFKTKIKDVTELGKSKMAFCLALGSAFLKGEEIDQLSVSHLCRIAKVSRTTFYTNYFSVSEVESDLEDIAITSLSNRFDKFACSGFAPNEFERMIRMYASSGENKISKILKKFIIDKVPSFYDKWTMALEWRFKDMFSHRSDKEIVLGVFVNAVQYGIREYLVSPDKYSPDFLSKSVSSLYNIFAELKLKGDPHAPEAK
ncbi:MAG: hypothetical protein MJ239_05925 [Bacilli bacterium]|nr:hypothetical protein [Bacilli bacterium]